MYALDVAHIMDLMNERGKILNKSRLENIKDMEKELEELKQINKELQENFLILEQDNSELIENEQKLTDEISDLKECAVSKRHKNDYSYLIYIERRIKDTDLATAVCVRCLPECFNKFHKSIINSKSYFLFREGLPIAMSFHKRVIKTLKYRKHLDITIQRYNRFQFHEKDTKEIISIINKVINKEIE
jgi:hypothetical protein